MFAGCRYSVIVPFAPQERTVFGATSSISEASLTLTNPAFFIMSCSPSMLIRIRFKPYQSVQCVAINYQPAIKNMPDSKILLVDEFVRSINVNKNSPHALFLGAGASLSSRVPSAGDCILEWKREIFVTNNPTLKDSVAELSIPSVRQRICLLYTSPSPRD